MSVPRVDQSAPRDTDEALALAWLTENGIPEIIGCHVEADDVWIDNIPSNLGAQRRTLADLYRIAEAAGIL